MHGFVDRCTWRSKTEMIYTMKRMVRSRLIGPRGPLFSSSWTVDEAREFRHLKKLVKEQSDFAWDLVLRFFEDRQDKEREWSRLVGSHRVNLSLLKAENEELRKKLETLNGKKDPAKQYRPSSYSGRNS
ncbi:hypothetical protein BJ508DRAFT_24321 [Ascobolus immersus RN42]|uniref:Uncharacterized protein n=1 Tax=Ascobolus immersus RN42 TaxID=1160509 RepID=A0A3N4HRL0_ASCIM|nr:hypothetical protein BJ508DRAFT_24321 [Ascobolus immersus RN42]